jgi:hypothetical protein
MVYPPISRTLHSNGSTSCNIMKIIPGCYSDGLRAGRSRSYRGKRFLYSTVSRPALAPSQPPTLWVPRETTPEAIRPEREADLQLMSRSRMVEIYLHLLIYLHDIVPNELSTGRTLPSLLLPMCAKEWLLKRCARIEMTRILTAHTCV